MWLNKQKRPIVNKIENISMLLLLASIAAVCAGIVMIVFSCVEIRSAVSFDMESEAIIARSVKEIAEGLSIAVHYTLVARFFITALKNGVPFTHEGAKEIRTIGWETIILPLIVQIIGIIAHIGIASPIEVFGIEIYEIVMGIILIQTGYVIDYGTEKIEAGHSNHQILRYIDSHYPDIVKEATSFVEREGSDNVAATEANCDNRKWDE